MRAQVPFVHEYGEPGLLNCVHPGNVFSSFKGKSLRDARVEVEGIVSVMDSLWAASLALTEAELTEPDTVYAKYLSVSTLGPYRAKSALLFWGLALGTSPTLAACTRGGGTRVLKQLGDKSGVSLSVGLRQPLLSEGALPV